MKKQDRINLSGISLDELLDAIFELGPEATPDERMFALKIRNGESEENIRKIYKSFGSKCSNLRIPTPKRRVSIIEYYSYPYDKLDARDKEFIIEGARKALYKKIKDKYKGDNAIPFKELLKYLCIPKKRKLSNDGQKGIPDIIYDMEVNGKSQTEIIEYWNERIEQSKNIIGEINFTIDDLESICKHCGMPTPSEIEKLEAVYSADFLGNTNQLNKIKKGQLQIIRERIFNVLEMWEKDYNNGKNTKYSGIPEHEERNDRETSDVSTIQKRLFTQTRRFIQVKSKQEEITREMQEEFIDDLNNFTDRNKEYTDKHGSSYKLTDGILDTAIGILGENPNLVRSKIIHSILLNAFQLNQQMGVIRAGRHLSNVLRSRKDKLINSESTSIEAYIDAIDLIIKDVSGETTRLSEIEDTINR